MSYTYTDGVDIAKPVSTTTAANTLAVVIQNVKKAYNERLDDVFGCNFASDDPIAITKLGLLLQAVSKQIKATLHDASSLGATPAIDWNNGINQKGTLTANATFTFSNPVAGSWYSLILSQDATGGRTVTFPATVRWTNNSAMPSLVTTANRVTTILFYYTGSVYLASVGGTGYNVS